MSNWVHCKTCGTKVRAELIGPNPTGGIGKLGAACPQCREPENDVLRRGRSFYEDLFASAAPYKVRT